jgi:hypothetical protein
MSGVETEASLRQEFGAPRAATQMIGLDDRPDGAAAMNPLGLLDVAAITEHVKMIHHLAQPLAGAGKLVVASYGENPTTHEKLTPKVEHFEIGAIDDMIRAVLRLATEEHRNVYCSLSVWCARIWPGAKKARRARSLDHWGLLPILMMKLPPNGRHGCPCHRITYWRPLSAGSSASICLINRSQLLTSSRSRRA